MAGEKLRLVQAAMNFVVDQLKDEDRLIIVLFDSDVQTVLPIACMGGGGKERAKLAIEQATAGSCTNLSGGLMEGLEQLKRREGGGDVCSLLLFTDGLANEGLRSTDEIVAQMKTTLGGMGPCPVYTFGFGTDHDPTMLRGISEAANGLYYYLRKEDEIPQAFGECIGGLLSVAAQNVKLIVEPREGAEVMEALSTYNKLGESDGLVGGSVGVSLGDLFSEERKDLLFRLKVNAVGEASDGEREVGVVRLGFFDAISGKLVNTLLPLLVRRVTEITEAEVANPKIDVQRNRLRCAAALRTATAAGEKDDLADARAIIQKAIHEIQHSQTAEDPFCVALIHDLKQADQTLTSKAQFKSEGHRYMSNAISTHEYQRCTENAWDSEMPQYAQQCYTTSHKMSMRSKANE